MPVVYSIFHWLGTGGGGKVRAVQHRLNAFAEMDGFQPVLLNLSHDIRQRRSFAQLRGSGALHPRVAFASLPDACLPAAIRAGTPVFTDHPSLADAAHDPAVTIRERVHQGVGRVLTMSYMDGKAPIRLTFLDGLPYRHETLRKDGSIVTTDFAAGRAICRWRTVDGQFTGGTNLITGAFHAGPRALEASLFELVDRTDAVVFFDGITSVYLAPYATPRSILFVHADHRNLDGTVNARARAMIEGFPGAAIVTATKTQRDLLTAETAPSRPIEVLPHFIASTPPAAGARANLVTVSRLSLPGKPVDQAIRAFVSIMDAFPGVDYLIYGSGASEGELAELIDELGCGARVRLMGYTDAPAAVFAGGLAAVAPTLGEGFGLSILEALSCGCPVISNDVNYGPREMIDGTNGLLVPPGDIAALGRAMRRILTDPAPFQAASTRGLERYGRDAYLRNYERLVTRVLNDRPADAASGSGSSDSAKKPAAPGRLDHYCWHDTGRPYRLDP